MGRIPKVLLLSFCMAMLSLSLGIPGSPLANTAKNRLNAAEKTIKVLREIEESLTATKYQGVTRVNRTKGEYFFDCSGMAEWVLRRSAPAALKAVGRPGGHRPLAVHFYRQIARIPLGERRGAWKRVESAAHIVPGDIIAWERPKWFPSKSTGHVAFAMSRPRLNTGEIQGLLVRVADASKFKHEDDSRTGDVTGFGTGILLIPTDRKAQPLGYGWIGSQTPEEWLIPADLVIGRPIR